MQINLFNSLPVLDISPRHPLGSSEPTCDDSRVKKCFTLERGGRKGRAA